MSEGKESYLRIVGGEVLAIDCAKLIVLPGSRRLAAWLRIAKTAKMNVLNACLRKPSTKPVFREARFARDCHRANVGEHLNVCALKGRNEPLDVGSLVPNCEDGAHGDLMVLAHPIGEPR